MLTLYSYFIYLMSRKNLGMKRVTIGKGLDVKELAAFHRKRDMQVSMMVTVRLSDETVISISFITK